MGEGGAELKITEVLRQQVWKSALAGVFFRLKRKLNEMSSDCNLLIFLKGRVQNLEKRKKKCLNVHIWGEYV